jgi:hypothetical protein
MMQRAQPEIPASRALVFETLHCSFVIIGVLCG